jgi:hypothetical protein
VIVEAASAVVAAIAIKTVIRRILVLLSWKDMTRETLAHGAKSGLKRARNGPKMGRWSALRTCA